MTEQANTPTPSQVVQRMLDIREKRAAVKKEYEERDRKLKQMYERGENWLLQHLQETGHAKFSVDEEGVKATVFKSATTRASIPDWQALADFIRESGEVDLLQHRVNSTNLKAYEKLHDALPPGVRTEEVVSLNIRKS